MIPWLAALALVVWMAFTGLAETYTVRTYVFNRSALTGGERSAILGIGTRGNRQDAYNTKLLGGSTTYWRFQVTLADQDGDSGINILRGAGKLIPIDDQIYEEGIDSRTGATFTRLVGTIPYNDLPNDFYANYNYRGRNP